MSNSIQKKTSPKKAAYEIGGGGSRDLVIDTKNKFTK